jgi:hypothetical protein
MDFIYLYETEPLAMKPLAIVLSEMGRGLRRETMGVI